jgi:hypothetical protein
MRSKSALQYKQEEAEIQRALRTIEGDPDSNISQLSRDSGLSYGRLLSRYHGRPPRSDRKCKRENHLTDRFFKFYHVILDLIPFVH